jgi:uncharacterized protein with PCYCGC motif
MGRKSSAKAQSQTNLSAQPPKEPPRSFGVPIVVAVVALVVVVGLLAYSRNDESNQAAAQPADAAIAQSQAPSEPPPTAKFGPHKQTKLPPLPFGIEQAVRPPAVVRDAYTFAAEHPEVLAYVPCYCGCERSGHRGNDDCFVTARAADGDVTQWEPHGMT